MDSIINITKKKGQEAVQKVKIQQKVVEKTLLIQEEREKQKDYFTSIGHIYYDAVLAHEIEVAESFEELLNIIKESDERIQKYELEIQQISNVKICPNCSAEFGMDSVFCSKCGTELADGDKFCFCCGTRIE